METKGRVVVHRAECVVDFTKLNDIYQRDLHLEMIRKGWFRNQDAVDSASNTFGPGHVTYYKWLDKDNV